MPIAGHNKFKSVPNSKSKKEVHFYSVKKIDFKEENGEFYSEGLVATTHPDKAIKGDRKGDILSKNAIISIVDQINNNRGLMANLASYRHDWVKEKNPDLPPVGKSTKAELVELEKGHFGAKVTTHHNKNHEDFDKIRYEVENGYLPGYSIEFESKKSQPVHLSDGEYRLIDELKMYGYGLANGRLIANPNAMIESFGYKEIMDAKNKMKENKEVNKMSEEEKKPEEVPKKEVKEEATKEEEKSEEKVEVDSKEYAKYKKFLDMELKEKKDTEIKELVKAQLAVALKEVMPENKIGLSNVEHKELTASIEYKEWSETNNDNVSVKEAFSRATRFAQKNGAFDRAYQNFHTGGQVFHWRENVEFKTGGFYGEKIELKALQTDTNQSSDTDYLQSAAELSDIYAPAVTKMLNQKTTWFGLLPKTTWSGREAITWRAENAANDSSGAYAEGGAVTKGNTTRQKLREEFKFYSAGMQVTGQMIESAKSGLGDVFQEEVESATRKLLSDMNIDLLGTNGAFSDLQFLGLEYIADSSSNTTLYGLTRSTTNLLGASGSEFDARASAAISKPTLRTAIRTLEINGADKTDLVFVCNPLQRDLILALIDDAQRFNGTTPRIGFEGMPMFDDVPIHSDKDVNNDDIFLCNLGANGLRMGVQVAVRFEDLAKLDDSRSGFIKFYGNQYALAPKQALYMIQGLATS